MDPTRTDLFSTSRSLTTFTNKKWICTLFERLNGEYCEDDDRFNVSKNTIYSIAFFLSFYRHCTDEDTFVISAELFNIIDDLILETDALSSRELMNMRDLKFEKKQLIKESTKHSRLIHDKIRLKYYNNFYKNYIDISTEDDEKFIRDILNDEEKTEVYKILKIINDYSFLPIYYNLACTRTVDAEESISIDEKNYSYRNFSPIRMYIHYAPAIIRYEELKQFRDLLKKRGITIYQILLPVPSPWQSTYSSLLWIVLHTIAALLELKNNSYISRFLILMKNLDFFIGCIDCSSKWQRGGGNSYFEYLHKLHPTIRYTIPIDLVLIKLHNNIQKHAFIEIKDESKLIGILMDYRQFASQLLNRNFYKLPEDCKSLQELAKKSKVLGIL